MVFSLPFHIARFFRPTVLDQFNLSNAELGDIFAIYGITAMLCYFPGGAIADYFSARKLLTLSLLATALGGIFLAQFPSPSSMSILFAYWGVTSILLFWAALIRATREWGGVLAQGKAFGFLDGGRGLIAAGGASIAVFIFSISLPDPGVATEMQRREALQFVIYFYTTMTFASSILVYLLVPENNRNHTLYFSQSLSGMEQVLRQRVIWLQSVIVICAYCGYKGVDNYALYAVEVLNMNEVESAEFTSIAAYLRPLAAICAGFLADKFTVNRIVKICFLLLIVSYAALSQLMASPSLINIIFINLIITFIAIFAIRGVYFALLEEFNVSNSITGAAVGLISVIGFTPDIFFYPIAGRLLDASPGIQGHQHFFLLLTSFTLVGMIAAVLLTCSKTNNKYNL